MILQFGSVMFSCGLGEAGDRKETRIGLHTGWRVHEAGTHGSHEADVPGTVHTDLMRAGVIRDPYHGTELAKVQWVEDRDWVYTMSFEVSPGTLEHEHLDLVFEGLDTFAEVRLNGAVIGSADNMHRTWRFPVKERLRMGRNELEVCFRSAVLAGEEKMRAYGRSLPADNDQGRVKVAPFVRKAGVHFGWDFAPRLVTCGIWRPVYLHGWDGARITGVRVEQRARNGQRELRIRPALEGTAPAHAMWRVAIDAGKVVTGSLEDGVRMMLPDTGLWWPAGMGDQRLRDLHVDLIVGERTMSTWQGRIGLRDILLHQEPDSLGTSFTFIVNGVPLFAMGANLVPPDQFLPRAGDKAWVDLVQGMAEANMNMVRVWGGGVYPPEAFFDACDEAGILVWQDLMFANTMVPDGEVFLANVRAEVEEQVARLQHRACLALWCGNNEIDVAWHNWGWQRTWEIAPKDSTRMWRSYANLFQEEMPRWIAALDDRPYVHTSPLSNWGNAEGLRHGDLHYWGVWHGDEPFEAFTANVGRFVSEYGFQSYPFWETLEAIAGPGDLENPGFWSSRQLSYKGDGAITRLAERYLGPVKDRRDLVEKSQALQAMACRMAIEAHHDARPRCMGTLLWQMNDVWPGASWSLIDHAGRRKPAYHTVQQAYGAIRAAGR